MAKRKPQPKSKSLVDKAFEAIDHAIHPDHAKTENTEEVENSSEVLDEEQVSNVFNNAEVETSEVKTEEESNSENKPETFKKVRGKDLKFET